MRSLIALLLAIALVQLIIVAFQYSSMSDYAERIEQLRPESSNDGR